MKPGPKSPSDTPPPSLLVFGAHPDDIEFGCGGVVACETRAGRPVHFVVCSRGESGTHGTPTQRTAEAKASAKILGATIEFADLGGDAHFEERSAHVVALAWIIRRVRPAFVLAPTTVENQHPDHVKLGRMVRDASRLARYGGVKELRRLPPHAIGQLLYYAVSPDAEPKDVTPLYIDVADVQEGDGGPSIAAEDPALPPPANGQGQRAGTATRHRCGCSALSQRSAGLRLARQPRPVRPALLK